MHACAKGFVRRDARLLLSMQTRCQLGEYPSSHKWVMFGPTSLEISHI
jgi:hypothetical protein